MGDRDGGVTGLAAPHEQKRHRLSHNQAATYHDDIRTCRFDADFFQETLTAERGARNEARTIVHHELRHVQGMKAVDVFSRIDGFNDRLFANVGWWGRLDLDAVNIGIGIEFSNQLNKRLLRGVRGKLVLDRVQTEFCSFLVF